MYHVIWVHMPSSSHPNMVTMDHKPYKGHFVIKVPAECYVVPFWL